MSVDFPAPFSPRSACASPRVRSKSIPSLATMPGNRFVIDRSSRIGSSAIRAGFYGGGRRRAAPAGDEEGRGIPALRSPRRPLLVLLRNGDLVRGDLLADRLELHDLGPRHL